MALAYKAQEHNPTPALPLKKGEGEKLLLPLSRGGWEGGAGNCDSQPKPHRTLSFPIINFEVNDSWESYLTLKR